MTVLAWVYVLYLAISGAITFYVARTLHRRGRRLLFDVFGGSEPVADAVNRLLVIGFYLVNIAFVTLTLHSGIRVVSLLAGIELLSEKVGTVLVVLGVMHFCNLAALYAVRSWRPAIGSSHSTGQRGPRHPKLKISIDFSSGVCCEGDGPAASGWKE